MKHFTSKVKCFKCKCNYFMRKTTCFTRKNVVTLITVMYNFLRNGSFISCFTRETLVFVRKTTDFTCKRIH